MPCKTKASPEEMLDQIASYLYQSVTITQADDFFYVRGIEVVFHRIIVGWCGNHYEVGILIGFFSIGCGFEVE